MDFTYNFPAIKGVQAQHEYYIAMAPLGLLSKLFANEEDFLLPEFRAQRRLNELRIPDIKNYILNNRSSYVFSALSASISGDFSFSPSELNANIGILNIDMNAIILINDGQHRKAAIEAALLEAPELENETISIVFFKDNGLKNSQQMFADLNKNAVKPSKSLSALYDDRDALSNSVKDTIKSIPFLMKYIDKERDTLAKYSSKLFTLSNFLRANQRIIKNNIVDDNFTNFIYTFWSHIFSDISEWKLLEDKQITKCAFKEEYILSLSVVMNAFGRLGNYFYLNQSQMSKLNLLNKINWLRCNDEWIGRCFNESGRIMGKEDNIIKICNLLKNKLNIELSKEEQVKENELKR